MPFFPIFYSFLFVVHAYFSVYQMGQGPNWSFAQSAKLPKQLPLAAIAR
jgi:hypothetical protein